VDIDSKAIERNVAIALLVDISFSRAEHTGWEFRMIRDGVEAFLRATFLVKSDSEAFVGAGHEDGRSGIDAGDEHGQDGGWRPFWLCLAGLKIMIGFLKSLKHRMTQISLPRDQRDFVKVCHAVGHPVRVRLYASAHETRL